MVFVYGGGGRGCVNGGCGGDDGHHWQHDWAPPAPPSSIINIHIHHTGIL